MKQTWHDKMTTERALKDPMVKTAISVKGTMQALQAVKNKTVKYDTAQGDKIRIFLGLITGSLDQLVDAGKLLVLMIEDDDKVMEKIVMENPSISMNFLYLLEKVGRGTIDKSLLFVPAWQRPRLAMLPPTDQSKLVASAVPVVKSKNHGNETYHVQAKRIGEMTHAEFNRAISTDGVVDPKQQISKLIAQKAKKDSYAGRYVVEGNEVVFLTRCRIGIEGLKNLLTLLEKIKPDATLIEGEIKKRQITRR